MNISSISSFLVLPGKNLENPPEVNGTAVPLAGRLYDKLRLIYEKSDLECCIPIRFVMAEDGSQVNEVRNKVISYIEQPTLNNGKILAERLRDCTTQKPGPALFFIILGRAGNDIKIVLSRFPAEEGIVAETKQEILQLEFIERVFMKNVKYKAAHYRDISLRGGFWKGLSIDKQLNDPNRQIADYWIRDFLMSDFETTSKEGTKRFAIALREASKSTTNLDTKKQLVALAILSPELAEQNVSINGISRRYQLSEETNRALISQLSYTELADDIFVLNAEEFSKHVMYKSIELNNESILMAPANKFDDCFQQEVINQESNLVRFTTQGQIVDEKIKGRK